MLKTQRRKYKKELSISTKYEAFYTGGNVQFTKDGSCMLCSCGEQVKVVNTKDGKILYSIGSKETDEELSSFLLASDDETLITAAKNGLLKQWNLKDRTLTRTWKALHNGKVACMVFDDTITLLATGGSDSTIKVWDIRQKYCTHNLKGAQGVFSFVRFTKISNTLHIFGSADDCKIRIWNLANSRNVATLDSHCSAVTDLLIIEEQSKIISCSRDKVIIVWDLDKCLEGTKPLRIIPIFEAVESIFLSPKELLFSLELDCVNDDDIYFVTAGEKGVLRIWEASTGKCLFTQTNSLIAPPIDSEHEGPVITQALHLPALDAIAVVTYEHNILLYTTEKLQLLKQFVGYNDDVLDLKLMGKNDSHLAVATNSPHIKVYELSTFSCQLLKGHLDNVIALDVFASDPYMLVSSSKDNSVRVWHMDHDTKIFTNIFVGYGHTHSITAVACSSGKSKFFLTGSEDTTLKLWTIPSKVPLVSLKLTVNAQCTIKSHDKNVNSIDISLNDKLIATGSQDHTAKIWDATDVSLIGTMRGHRKGIWCVKFSPIDLVLATSSGDGKIKIWSLSDYSTLKTFEGHESSVLQVLFLSKGTQLITSGSDGLLKLWDIKDNECIKTYDDHESKIWALTVSSDEEFIISGGADSNIVLWKDITKEEEEKLIIKQEEFLLREQDLSNLILQKKWTEALKLAIILDQPFRALNIMNEILMINEGSALVEETIKKLEQDQIDMLLKFALEWNTNSRNYLLAQIVVKTIIKMYSTDELLKMPERRLIVESLLPYTERHYHRLSKMQQDAHILKFLWQNIKVSNAEKFTDDRGSQKSLLDSM